MISGQHPGKVFVVHSKCSINVAELIYKVNVVLLSSTMYHCIQFSGRKHTVFIIVNSKKKKRGTN